MCVVVYQRSVKRRDGATGTKSVRRRNGSQDIFATFWCSTACYLRHSSIPCMCVCLLAVCVSCSGMLWHGFSNSLPFSNEPHRLSALFTYEKQPRCIILRRVEITDSCRRFAIMRESFLFWQQELLLHWNDWLVKYAICTSSLLSSMTTRCNKHYY